MKGRLFGVGVGPGDPELMTYKAVRTIEKCPVIAVPAKGREHAVSYRIAAGMVDNMEEKEYLDLDTPMTKDRQILNQNYEKAAKRIIEEGANVVVIPSTPPLWREISTWPCRSSRWDTPLLWP